MTAPFLTFDLVDGDVTEWEWFAIYTFTRDSVTNARIELLEYETYLHDAATHDTVDEVLRWARNESASVDTVALGDVQFRPPVSVLYFSDFGVVDLCLRVRARDERGQWTDWTPLETVSVEFEAPTLSELSPAGSSLPTLAGVRFMGSFTGDAGFAQVQVRPAAASTWGLSDVLWDSGRRHSPNLPENPSSEDATPGLWYNGPRLSAEDYEWRMRAWSPSGAVSEWVEADFTLTDYSDVDVTP